MTHVRSSPYHPQSNGKIERWHKTMKSDSIRVTPPSTLEEARRIVERFVAQYNAERLHSAIGYVTPNDVPAGRQAAIWAERDRKLEVRCAGLRRPERRGAGRCWSRSRRLAARPPATPSPRYTNPPAVWFTARRGRACRPPPAQSSWRQLRGRS